MLIPNRIRYVSRTNVFSPHPSMTPRARSCQFLSFDSLVRSSVPSDTPAFGSDVCPPCLEGLRPLSCVEDKYSCRPATWCIFYASRGLRCLLLSCWIRFARGCVVMRFHLVPPFHRTVSCPAGEAHLHMQQYIRATQLPITTKFTLSPFTKEEVRRARLGRISQTRSSALTVILQSTLLPDRAAEDTFHWNGSR